MIDAKELVAQLHNPASCDELAAVLNSGMPVVVVAEPGAAESELVAELCETDVVRIDARAAGTHWGLLVEVTRVLIDRLLPNSDIGLHASSVAREDAYRLAEAFGAHGTDAISATMGLPTERWTLDAALEGVHGAVLVIEHAHLLTEKWAERALWTMRNRVAHTQLKVVLLTRQWHAERLLGHEEAFFGLARRIDLRAAISEERMKALNLSGSDEQLLEIDTNRQISTIAEVLLAARSNGGVQPAYETLVASRSATANALLSAAHRIHPLAAQLLLAIAHDLPPYREAIRVPPQRVATALNALRDADLIYQPEPRRWILADPLTAEALRRRNDAMRGRLSGALVR